MAVLQPVAALEDFILPPLREDLALHRGPRRSDGSPTWSLHDPVRNSFFRIGWLEFELLVRWRTGSAGALLARVHAETTLHTGPEQVREFAAFLGANQLLRVQGAPAIDRLRMLAQAGRADALKQLFHHYLFLRVPLLRPDDWLRRALPYVEWIYRRSTAWCLFGIALLGLYLVARQWDTFLGTFSYLFSMQGMLLFATALFLSKAVHELGHAFTARRYGVRIPTMGVALLVLWPVLYTDTGESWKLADRRRRLAIAGAGMLAELALAAVATLLWSFLPDGPLRSAVFVIATTTWIVTLLVNLNPLVRFDGYYLLSDLLEIQNLQDRSFALGRWKLREWLLGLREPCPEALPPRRRRLLIGFAYAVWLYRFFLFLGIALLVYFFFFKLAGVVLMLAELGWFIALPVYRELRTWVELRERVRWNRNTVGSAAALLLTGLLLVYPISWDVRVPAVLKYAGYTEIHAPYGGRIREVPVRAGDAVEAGQTLAILESPELDYLVQQARRRVTLLREDLLRQSAYAELLDRRQVVQQQLAEAMTELQGYERRQEQLRIVAPHAATVIEWDADLQPGRWINERLPLGLLVDRGTMAIQGYAAEQEIERIAIGAEGEFLPEDPGRAGIAVRLAAIDRVNTRALDVPYLASVYGGPIAVTKNAEGELLGNAGLYRLHLSMQTPGAESAQVLRGTVFLDGEPQSLLYRAWLFVGAVFIRESGF